MGVCWLRLPFSSEVVKYDLDATSNALHIIINQPCRVFLIYLPQELNLNCNKPFVMFTSWQGEFSSEACNIPTGWCWGGQAALRGFGSRAGGFWSCLPLFVVLPWPFLEAGLGRAWWADPVLPSRILFTFLLSQTLLDLSKDGWMSWKSWSISLRTLACSREYWILLLSWVMVQDRFSWSFWASLSSVPFIPGGTLRSTVKPLHSCSLGRHHFYVRCFSNAGTVKN